MNKIEKERKIEIWICWTDWKIGISVTRTFREKYKYCFDLQVLFVNLWIFFGNKL